MVLLARNMEFTVNPDDLSLSSNEHCRVLKTSRHLMVELKGTQIDYLDYMRTRQETYELLGYSEFGDLENRYLPPEQ
jgi:hypothetical protein